MKRVLTSSLPLPRPSLCAYPVGLGREQEAVFGADFIREDQLDKIIPRKPQNPLDMSTSTYGRGESKSALDDRMEAPPAWERTDPTDASGAESSQVCRFSAMSNLKEVSRQHIRDRMGGGSSGRGVVQDPGLDESRPVFTPGVGVKGFASGAGSSLALSGSSRSVRSADGAARVAAAAATSGTTAVATRYLASP